MTKEIKVAGITKTSEKGFEIYTVKACTADDAKAMIQQIAPAKYEAEKKSDTGVIIGAVDFNNRKFVSEKSVIDSYVEVYANEDGVTVEKIHLFSKSNYDVIVRIEIDAENGQHTLSKAQVQMIYAKLEIIEFVQNTVYYDVFVNIEPDNENISEAIDAEISNIFDTSNWKVKRFYEVEAIYSIEFSGVVPATVFEKIVATIDKFNVKSEVFKVVASKGNIAQAEIDNAMRLIRPLWDEEHNLYDEWWRLVKNRDRCKKPESINKYHDKIAEVSKARDDNQEQMIPFRATIDYFGNILKEVLDKIANDINFENSDEPEDCAVSNYDSSVTVDDDTEAKILTNATDTSEVTKHLANENGNDDYVAITYTGVNFGRVSQKHFTNKADAYKFLFNKEGRYAGTSCWTHTIEFNGKEIYFNNYYGKEETKDPEIIACIDENDVKFHHSNYTSIDEAARAMKDEFRSKIYLDRTKNFISLVDKANNFGGKLYDAVSNIIEASRLYASAIYKYDTGNYAEDDEPDDSFLASYDASIDEDNDDDELVDDTDVDSEPKETIEVLCWFDTDDDYVCEKYSFNSINQAEAFVKNTMTNRANFDNAKIRYSDGFCARLIVPASEPSYVTVANLTNDIEHVIRNLHYYSRNAGIDSVYCKKYSNELRNIRENYRKKLYFNTLTLTSEMFAHVFDDAVSSIEARIKTEADNKIKASKQYKEAQAFLADNDLAAIELVINNNTNVEGIEFLKTNFCNLKSAIDEENYSDIAYFALEVKDMLADINNSAITKYEPPVVQPDEVLNAVEVATVESAIAKNHYDSLVGFNNLITEENKRTTDCLNVSLAAVLDNPTDDNILTCSAFYDRKCLLDSVHDATNKAIAVASDKHIDSVDHIAIARINCGMKYTAYVELDEDIISEHTNSIADAVAFICNYCDFSEWWIVKSELNDNKNLVVTTIARGDSLDFQLFTELIDKFDTKFIDAYIVKTTTDALVEVNNVAVVDTEVTDTDSTYIFDYLFPTLLYPTKLTIHLCKGLLFKQDKDYAYDGSFDVQSQYKILNVATCGDDLFLQYSALRLRKYFLIRHCRFLKWQYDLCKADFEKATDIWNTRCDWCSLANITTKRRRKAAKGNVDLYNELVFEAYEKYEAKSRQLNEALIAMNPFYYEAKYDYLNKYIKLIEAFADEVANRRTLIVTKTDSLNELAKSVNLQTCDKAFRNVYFSLDSLPQWLNVIESVYKPAIKIWKFDKANGIDYVPDFCNTDSFNPDAFLDDMYDFLNVELAKLKSNTTTILNAIPNFECTREGYVLEGFIKLANSLICQVSNYLISNLRHFYRLKNPCPILYTNKPILDAYIDAQRVYKHVPP